MSTATWSTNHTCVHFRLTRLCVYFQPLAVRLAHSCCCFYFQVTALLLITNNTHQVEHALSKRFPVKLRISNHFSLRVPPERVIGQAVEKRTRGHDSDPHYETRSAGSLKVNVFNTSGRAETALGQKIHMKSACVINYFNKIRRLHTEKFHVFSEHFELCFNTLFNKTVKRAKHTCCKYIYFLFISFHTNTLHSSQITGVTGNSNSCGFVKISSIRRQSKSGPAATRHSKEPIQSTIKWSF